MRQSYELWVLAAETRDRAAIERCVTAAGHRIAQMAHSMGELRAHMTAHRMDAAHAGRVLLLDAALTRAPGATEPVAELVRLAGLPAVELVAEPSEPAPPAGASEPALADAGLVTCALAARELALAVDLAVARHALARAQAERDRHRDEIRQLNRVLARCAADLQAANNELDVFSFSVSHDLRAPLRAIDGLSQIVLNKLDDGVAPHVQIYLQHIRQASARLSRLIADLLALSRLTRREMRLQPCDLGAMAREILSELERADPDRVVEIHVAPELTARADATLLRVLLESLLGNAWKFTSRTPAARIEVGATTRDGQPAYFVRDNGVGFDMTAAEKLFGPFQRMHSAHEFEGTGIGLAKAQRIVRRHGGDIWAEAAPGRGATFTFTLS